MTTEGLELTATCGCGRRMRPDALRGRGHMVCGCGLRVHVEVPNRMAYQPGMCAWVDDRRGCTRPALFPQAPLCEEHLRQAVNVASANRWRLASNQVERQQLPRIASDITATPEGQRRARSDEFARNVRAQKDKIHRAVVEAGEVVYYARLAPDRLKIGVSYDLRVRLKAMRVPDGNLLAVEPGDVTLEKQRHRQFAQYRIDRSGSREEYGPGPKLMDWIANVHAEQGDPFGVIQRLRLAAVADMRGSGPLLFGPNQGIYDDIEARLRTGEVAL